MALPLGCPVSQPPPVPSDTPEVWPRVIDDVLRDVYAGDGGASVPPYWRQRLAAEMEERNAFGVAKYGLPVQVENGRDPLRDALDEALDMSCYTRQQYEKTKRKDDWLLHCDSVRFAARILQRLALRAEEGT